MYSCNLVEFSQKGKGSHLAKLRLDSWKSIASHLNRGQRTVQRWHAEQGLPVHHFGGTQGCVFAYAEELDKWLLRLDGAPGPNRASEDQKTDGPDKGASDLTALADQLWATRSEKNIGSIAELYREALDRDPSNTRSLTGLASAMISSAILEVVDSSVAHTYAMEALRRTPQFDAQHDDAKCCAAFLKMTHERKWRQARLAFEDILRVHPQHSFGLKGRACLHIADGELEDASRCAWEAWRQTPLASSPGILLCWIEFLAGHSEEALDLIEQFKNSGLSGSMMATIHALTLSQSAPDERRIRQIERTAEEFQKSRTLQGVLGYVYAISGQTAKATQVLIALKDLCERKKKNCGYALALVLLGLDKRQEAISWLETSFEQGSVWSLGFRSDPILKPLRGDPRFEALLRKIGSRPEARSIDQVRIQPKSLRFPVPITAAGASIRSSEDALDELEGLVESGAA